METITIKVPDGTKAKLRQLNRNVSALIRERIEETLAGNCPKSAYEKAKRYRGIFKSGRRDLSTTKDYLKHYADKDHR